MKKITLTLLTIITLSYACSSDDVTTSSRNLQRVDRVFHNTGNTATLNYDSSDKLTSFYTNGTTLKNSLEYNTNNQMTKFTIFDDDGNIDKQYTFTYDGNGNITSVHDFFASPFYTSEPVDQDRVVSWSGNKMTLPLLVDDVNNRYNLYEFTFNTANLLSNYKVTEWDGDVTFNLNFTYDINLNVTRIYGFYDGFLQNVNVNQYLTYDDKNNPYFPHYNRHYINNLIIFGARPGGGFIPSYLLTTIQHFGKNNPLFTDVNNPNAIFYNYEYEGDYPTKSFYRNSSTILTTSSFIYQ